MYIENHHLSLERYVMPIAQRIAALKTKHTEIDEQIQEIENGASTDFVEISKLKAMKLSIKDEIEKLQKQID